MIVPLKKRQACLRVFFNGIFGGQYKGPHSYAATIANQLKPSTITWLTFLQTIDSRDTKL
ncbi:MAG: hypothetical protein CMC56_01115 [Flavobacteriaceae bacterium]|nr:hypothetical protein [Flavobacteriaceae bacterium]